MIILTSMYVKLEHALEWTWNTFWWVSTLHYRYHSDLLEHERTPQRGWSDLLMSKHRLSLCLWLLLFGAKPCGEIPWNWWRMWKMMEGLDWRRILLEILILVSKCLCFICYTLFTLVLRMLWLLWKVLYDPSIFFNEYYINCQYWTECLIK